MALRRLALLFALIYGIVATETTLELWEGFKVKFDKNYMSQSEHDYRFQVFKGSLEQIRILNANDQYATYGITPFADLTATEFREGWLMNLTVETPEAPVAEEIFGIEAPASFDWRNTAGVVTPVKNQGQCGSCWAFSALETIESAWARTKHSLQLLSPQQMVDCDTRSSGCRGGWPYWAFQYIQSAGGSEGEATYPYTARDDRCTFDRSKVIAKIGGWQYVTQSKSETQMQNFLHTNFPLSVCVDASKWQLYKSGVIRASECGHTMNHCVQATGWSTVNGIPAWNLRNSWGPSWGVSGYVHVEFGQNTCGVAQVVTVPK